LRVLYKSLLIIQKTSPGRLHCPQKPAMWYNLGMVIKNAHCLVTDSGDALATEESLREYLRLVEKARQEHGLKLPAYALLPGRALLYFVTAEADLHSVMGGFAKGANLPGYKTGNCKYKIIQPENYAAHLARYIHFEAVKEGLAEKPEAYEWSSAAQYLGAAGNAEKGIVLGTFSADAAEAVSLYSAFMAETVPGKFRRPFGKNRDAVLGDKAFLAAHNPHAS